MDELAASLQKLGGSLNADMLDKLLEHRTYCLMALHGYLKRYNDNVE